MARQRRLREEAENREFQHGVHLRMSTSNRCTHRFDVMLAASAPTSPRGHSQMPSLPSESVMNRFVEFINTANEDLAPEVISADAVFHAPSHPQPLRGPEGYMEVLEMMRSGFPDVQ